MTNREHWVRVLVAAGLALAGALGAWLPAEGRADPVSALVWLGLIAPGAGALAAGLGVGLLPLGWLVPLSWCAPVAWISLRSWQSLPALASACAAWSGLFVLGVALGELGRRRAWSPYGVAGALALVSLLAGTLPMRGALDGRPWPSGVARALFEVAPTTLVAESAGVDWMRHEASYEAVATDRFERNAWRGPLAGSVLLLVGCALIAIARKAPARTPTPAPNRRG